MYCSKKSIIGVSFLNCQNISDDDIEKNLSNFFVTKKIKKKINLIKFLNFLDDIKNQLVYLSFSIYALSSDIVIIAHSGKQVYSNGKVVWRERIARTRGA